MRGLIVTTDGFEDSEFSYPYYRLREARHDVDVATPAAESVEGKHGQEFDADVGIDEYEPAEFADEYDFLVIPGGYAPEKLRIEAPIAADLVEAFDEADQPIAAICHGAQLLISADVIEGREVAGYWTLDVDIENAGAEFVDGTLVTAREPDDLPAFASAFFKVLEETEERAVPA